MIRDQFPGASYDAWKTRDDRDDRDAGRILTCPDCGSDVPVSAAEARNQAWAVCDRCLAQARDAKGRR